MPLAMTPWNYSAGFCFNPPSRQGEPHSLYGVPPARALPRGLHLLQCFCAAFESIVLVHGEFRFQDFERPIAADDGWQRKGDTVTAVIAASRNGNTLIAQDRFRDARRYDADPVLARVVAFDDRDVGIANFTLDPSLELVKTEAAALDFLGDRHASYPRRRPHEHLRGAVLTQNLRLG